MGPKERSMKPIGILGETVLEPKDNQERVFPGSANVATRRNAGENQLRPRDTLEERVSTCTFSAGEHFNRRAYWDPGSQGQKIW